MGLGTFLHGDPQAGTPGATVGPARAYELFSTLAFGGRRRRVFTELVVLSGAGPGDRVLDVGCGPGYLTNLAADAVRPAGVALGIDPSPTVIDYATRHTTRDKRGQVRVRRHGQPDEDARTNGLTQHYRAREAVITRVHVAWAGRADIRQLALARSRLRSRPRAVLLLLGCTPSLELTC